MASHMVIPKDHLRRLVYFATTGLQVESQLDPDDEALNMNAALILQYRDALDMDKDETNEEA